MVSAQHLIASWQLFPERGTYEFGERPKSGTCRIAFGATKDSLLVTRNWVSIADEAFSQEYHITPDGVSRMLDGHSVSALLKGDDHLETVFHTSDTERTEVIHEITPKGLLRIESRIIKPDGTKTNLEVYHKQLSVLPYAASVSGAVIKPTEEGVIRHQALSAMEEQTNMQLTQIKQQIELLAAQAREIQNRKELSNLIYYARMGFHPVIGQKYYLYEKEDGEHLLSMVSPPEWGSKIPYKRFVSAVKLLADHTWQEA